MNKMFISKRLFNIVSILGITLFCNTSTYAANLKEIFNDSDNTIDFTADVIKNSGTVITEDIESEDFTTTNNDGIYTTHINMNTLSTQNVVLSSISGSNNISLQQWNKDSKVPTSITFSSNDNTKYTGTLYLHPSINHITFTKPNSVIRNINFPNSIPNTGSDKNTVPFIKSNEPKTLTISVPSNENSDTDYIYLTIIPSNTTVHITNIDNTKRNRFNNSKNSKPIAVSPNTDKILNDGVFKIINISNEEYEIKNQNYLSGNVLAKFDFSDQKNYYNYSNLKCNSCNSTFTIDDDDYKTMKPLDLIKNIKCSNCKSAFHETNIDAQAVIDIRILADLSTNANAYCGFCGNTIKSGDYKDSDSPYTINVEQFMKDIYDYITNENHYNCDNCKAKFVWPETYYGTAWQYSYEVVDMPDDCKYILQ